jgi:diguanylate cyclase (GGDEF)-like protein/PAS domain S-box-containing protein
VPGPVPSRAAVESLRVLLVEDNASDANLVRLALRRARGASFALTHVESLAAAAAHVANNPVDVLLLDLSLPGSRGMETLTEALRIAPGIPVVVMTGLDDVEMARRAVQEGAQDYLVKGQMDAALLERAMFHALERARYVVALRESEERYALAVRGANDGLWDWDLRENKVYFSPRWKEMLGLPEDAAIVSPAAWHERVHEEDRAILDEAIAEHLAGRTTHVRAEVRARHEDGSYRWMLVRGVATSASGRPVRMAGSQTDVTERKRLEERLRHDALHDPLTALPNRALFMDRLVTTLRRSQGREHQLFAVLFLDLDRLKIVNDTLGHGAGDHLIVVTARRLESCLRPGDTVARVGGDEFALLLDEVSDLQDAVQVAERIQAAVSEPISYEGSEIGTTVSTGIALSDPQYVRAEDIVRDADVAMYRAKKNGKARHEVFDAHVPGGAFDTYRWESDLQRALERGALELRYAPIVRVSDGRWTGLDAALSWEHPSRGALGTDDILPIAEETGLGIALGRWMITTACRDAATWMGDAAAASLPVSIRVGTRHLAQRGFAEQVGQSMRETGVPASLIRIEIADAAAGRPSDAVIATLRELEGLGVRLGLADFGAAATSLRRLYGLPIETLRIAAPLVEELGVDDADTTMVEALVRLACQLGVEPLATGVHSSRQDARLKGLACGLATGPFYGAPLPAPDVPTSIPHG